MIRRQVSKRARITRLARFGYLLLILPVVLFAVSGCSGNQAAVKAGTGESFTIGVGQSGQVTGEDMVITFDEVIGDSRCPKNVTCIWAGIVSSQVTIAFKGDKYPMALNQPGLTDQAIASFMGYTLTFRIDPYPQEGETIAAKDYKMTLTVTK
jgi:hypothetical protein